MTIKSLEITLSLGEPGNGVPVIPSGQVPASGYYTDPATGYRYYYDSHRDQWYVAVAGYLYPLSISWQPSPSNKLELAKGDTLKFRLRFYYIGPAVTRMFYVAIGDNKTSGSFGEWLGCNETKDIDLPDCDTARLFTDKYIDLVLPAEVWNHQGYDFAAYVKIIGGLTLTEGVNCTPYYYDVGRIIAKEGEFIDFSITGFEKVPA